MGAAITLSSLIGILQDNRSKSNSFEHLINHLLRVANVSVRNMASWAGNLMFSHIHGNSSDVFTMMVGIGAKVVVGKSYYSLCIIMWITFNPFWVVSVAHAFGLPPMNY